MKLIDLGNSNGKIFSGDSLEKIATDKIIDYLKTIDEEVILCSVVPRYNSIIASQFPNVRLITNQDYKLMFDNDALELETKGADRMIAAFAAVTSYGPNVVVIDIGTCVTYDVVSNRNYIGGLIYPGFAMLENILSDKIVQLPKGKYDGGAISTDSQIYLASLYGFVGALQNMLKQMIPNDSYQVVVTGGSIAKFKEEYNFDLLKALEVDAIYDSELIKTGLIRFNDIKNPQK